MPINVRKNLAAIVLAALLIGCWFLGYSTRDLRNPSRTPSASEHPLVDNGILQSVLKLAPSAATAEEQVQAREAWRLSDHELGLAFAEALRDAEAEAEGSNGGNANAHGPLRKLRDNIARLKQQVDAARKRVQELGDEDSEDLDVAKAQLALAQDELEDAQQDLAREGGDKRSKLQRLLEEHEASDKASNQALKFATPGPTGTMFEQVREWLALGDYRDGLEQVEQLVAAHSRTLLSQHDAREAHLRGQTVDADTPVEKLKQLSLERKALAGLDGRLQDTRQLATVFQNWTQLAGYRRRAVLHLMLRSLSAILILLLATVILHDVVRRSFPKTERHRQHQLRMIARTALQIVAVLGILLIVFGPPTQISTMIGLVTAGLTVVMKDFIVAFFGWFILLGKNGMRVGDWVEIEGVSGEVIEIGLLKTTLLELGNWTATGHPTGRRVSFSNSFALERHYFNFSTSDQWLWDELQLMLPRSSDPYQTAERIRDLVERETQEDAAAAAHEWARVTSQYGAREFSARPAVHLRPGLNGLLEVVVRYITRAPQRNVVKAKLSQALVEVLRKPA